jgi:hypothetical protein
LPLGWNFKVSRTRWIRGSVFHDTGGIGLFVFIYLFAFLRRERSDVLSWPGSMRDINSPIIWPTTAADVRPDCHWDGISKFPGRDGSGDDTGGIGLFVFIYLFAFLRRERSDVLSWPGSMRLPQLRTSGPIATGMEFQSFQDEMDPGLRISV